MILHQNKLRFRLVAILGASLIAAGLAACSDDEEGGSAFNNQPSPCADVDCPEGEECVVEQGEGVCEPVEGNHEDLCEGVECGPDEVCDPDTGECVEDGSGDLCEGVECPPGEFCDESTGECVASEADVGYACEVPEEVMNLSDGDSLDFSFNTDDQPRIEKTACSTDSVGGGHVVVAFTVDEPMWIDLEISGSERQLVQEIRKADCSDYETALSPGCINVYNNAPNRYEIEDTDAVYYAIIEARHNQNGTGSFDLSIETEEMFCAPIGSYSCVDGEARELCHAGTEFREYDCATSCDDGLCDGHHCDNAIVVTGAMTLEGDVNAYDNQFDFTDHPECSTAGPETIEVEGRRSNGQDILFSFPGLAGGQSIYIDARGGTADSTSYFGVLEDCSMTEFECIGGEDQGQVLEFEVPEAGDYYVIWNQNRVPPLDQEFHFEVDILD